MADEHLTQEPYNRLTRLCAVARDAVIADPEWHDDDTDKLFVSVDSDTERKGAFYTRGYDGPREVVVSLLMHIRALSRAVRNSN